MPRGQAAMEFIITYGWAMLVVLIMISSLAYFGVFDTKGVMPDRCFIQQEIHCRDQLIYTLDHAGTDKMIALILIQNNLPEAMTNLTISATRPDGTQSEICGITDGFSNPTLIKPGQVLAISCRFPDDGIAGEKYKINFNGTYKLQTGFYNHPISGEIVTLHEGPRVIDWTTLI